MRKTQGNECNCLRITLACKGCTRRQAFAEAADRVQHKWTEVGGNPNASILIVLNELLEEFQARAKGE